MAFLRQSYDYARYHLLAHARPITSVMTFLLGAGIFIATRLLSLPAGVAATLPFVSGALILLSATLLARDFLAWRRGQYDATFVPDERFLAKAGALVPEAGSTLHRINESIVTFDPEINKVLNAIRTPVTIRPHWYTLPKALKPFQSLALRDRRPTMNERKVRLASDMTVEAIISGRAAELQPTNYFLGISTNEMAGQLIEQVDRKQATREALSIFDLYVAKEARLVPLSQSMLSNHIGASSLVVTGDDYIVLQWQGSTQVDRNKVNAGASGSADWNDIAAANRSPARPQDMPGLQAIVTCAMERETREELGAQTGDGNAKTTITGFARYVHRGGKPEFFGITWLRQNYDTLRVRRSEARWVRIIEKRPLDGSSTAALLRGIEKLEAEFDPSRTAQASISMLLALRFAREFIRYNPNYVLRP